MNSGDSVSTAGTDTDRHAVVTALFDDVRAAEEAVRELREIDIPAGSISIISRDEDHTRDNEAVTAGVAREVIGDEGLAYRASSELPNYEDLPTTNAEQIGQPLITDVEVPPDEAYAGGARLGLTGDADMVRRNEAETNADVDIYTDFPDKPGGVNPNSPVAAGIEKSVQEPMKNRTGPGSAAAAGAGIGGFAGLAIGLAALAIPGVGPFVAAGPIALALGSIAAGTAAGGVISALASQGVPEEYARSYAAGIQQGQTLVSVRADQWTCDAVERVLTAHGGQEIH